MDAIELNATPRTVVGKQARALRRSGQVPIVLYGPGVAPLNLQVEARHLRRVLMQAGRSRLINVQVDGTSYPALAREVQRNPIRGDFLHVDLYAVDIHKRVRAIIPVVLDGEPEIVRSGGALVTHGVAELEVEALPTELPPAIRVDISGLKEIGAAVHVRDLAAMEGVEIQNSPDDLIVRLTAPMAEEIVQPVVEAEASPEVEVIKKGKGEEEEGEEEE
jgi:large subunit ribosomal protein L25